MWSWAKMVVEKVFRETVSYVGNRDTKHNIAHTRQREVKVRTEERDQEQKVQEKVMEKEGQKEKMERTVTNSIRIGLVARTITTTITKVKVDGINTGQDGTTEEAKEWDLSNMICGQCHWDPLEWS